MRNKYTLGTFKLVSQGSIRHQPLPILKVLHVESTFDSTPIFGCQEAQEAHCMFLYQMVYTRNAGFSDRCININESVSYTQKTSSKRNHRFICLGVNIERELGMRCCEAPQIHQINTVQFKTAPVGENGKTVIKQSCIYFFRDSEENPGSFFFINRCAKKRRTKLD